MAAALAVGLGATRLVFLTDVPGLLLGGEVVATIAADEAEELLENDLLEGGILPKLHAAVHAARSGVQADLGETEVVA
jgi:acetylglutamate kinase